MTQVSSGDTVLNQFVARLLPTRLEGGSVRYLRRQVEEALGCGLACSLLLNDCGLVALLARHVGQHELTELHELLNLLFRNLPHDLQRFHPAMAGLGHRTQRIQDGLFTLELLSLEARGAKAPIVVSRDVCDQL